MVLFFEAISEMGNSCFPKQKSRKDPSSLKIDPRSTVALDEDDVNVKYLDDKESEPKTAKVESDHSVRDEKRAAIKNHNLRKLRNDLKKNPENFVLNNLLLSVEFFKNYERDKLKANMKKDEEEVRLSTALEKSRTSCVFENPINAIVGEYISLIPKGEKQGKIIGSLKYMVLQEQTEVSQESSADTILNSGYSKVKGTTRLVMEGDDTSPGFFLLRCPDEPKRLPLDTGFNSPDSTDGSEHYSRLSDYDPEFRRSQPSSEESKAEDEGDQPADIECDSTTPMSPGRELLEQLEGQLTKPVLTRPYSAPNLSQMATRGISGTNAPVAKRKDMRMEEEGKTVFRKGRERRLSGVMPNTRVLVRRGSQFNILDSNETQLRGLAISEDSEIVAPLQAKLKAKKEKAETRNQSSESLISSSEESIYAKIDDLRRPLPSRNSTGSAGILENCIKDVRMVVKDTEEDNRDNPLGLLINSNMELRHYLSSHLFLAKFSSSIFHDYADRLNFARLLDSAHVLPPSIYIHDYPEEGNSKVYSCTPGIQIPWPETYFEWSMRNRQKVRDTRTGLVYKWPHSETVELVRQQGCYLVPKGCTIKGRSVGHADLQWEVSFSKAESTLLSTLTHAQMRCLYWAFLLYEDQLAEFGDIDTKHITSVVFSMLEQNYAAWSEVNLADNLRLIYQNLHLCLSRRKLPNYFYNKRNMLRSRQNHGLRRVQERIFRVLENLTPHILNIGKRLQSSIFPLPNFDRLRQILNNSPSSLLAQINPALLPAETESRFKSEEVIADDGEDGFWSAENKNKLKKMDPTRRYLKENYKKMQAEKATDKATAATEDDDVYTYRNQPLGRTQSQLLLEYFVDHFLELARRAVEYKSYREASMLTDHCDNLVVLLSELGFTADTEIFIEEISRIRKLFRKEQYREQKTIVGLDFQIRQRGQNWVLKKTEPLPEIPGADPHKKIPRSDIGKALGNYPLGTSETELSPSESGSEFTRQWVEAQFHKSDSEDYEYATLGIPNVSTYEEGNASSELYGRLDSYTPFMVVEGGVDDEEESTDF